MRLTLFLLLVALTYNSVVSSSKGLIQVKTLIADSPRELTRRKLRDGVVEADVADMEERGTSTESSQLSKFTKLVNDWKGNWGVMAKKLDELKETMKVKSSLAYKKVVAYLKKVRDKIKEFKKSRSNRNHEPPIEGSETSATNKEAKSTDTSNKPKKDTETTAKPTVSTDEPTKEVAAGRKKESAPKPVEVDKGEDVHMKVPNSNVAEDKVSKTNGGGAKKLKNFMKSQWKKLKKDTETTAKPTVSTDEPTKEVAAGRKKESAPKPVEVDKGKNILVEESHSVEAESNAVVGKPENNDDRTRSGTSGKTEDDHLSLRLSPPNEENEITRAGTS